MNERTEFGATRSKCSCAVCRANCHYIPGHLIPSDLTRLIPADADPFAWAEEHLLASPGAQLATRSGEQFTIPTLVPASRPDGSCHWLGSRSELCGVHQNAPFGCAFFSCTDHSGDTSSDVLVREGLKAIAQDHVSGGLYTRLWCHLQDKGLVALPIAERRRRLLEHLFTARSKGRKHKS